MSPSAPGGVALGVGLALGGYAIASAQVTGETLLMTPPRVMVPRGVVLATEGVAGLALIAGWRGCLRVSMRSPAVKSCARDRLH